MFIEAPAEVALTSRTSEMTAQTWHARIGHQGTNVLIDANTLFRLGIAKSQITHQNQCVCSVCIVGKGRRTQIGQEADPKQVATATLDCLRMDLIGPVSVFDGRGKNRLPTIGGNLYGLVIVEEFSRAVLCEPSTTQVLHCRRQHSS